jgi:cell fate regulator YaaT (PSP1 superfamily)
LIHYYIRIGALGEIRLASGLIPVDRGRRVVLRSPRGIEVAEVISRRRSSPADADADAPHYRIMRPTSPSDELLVSRLDRYKRQAMESCRKRLRESGSEATLLDVDQLLDGGTLMMHFLGDIDDGARSIADQIAEEYESVVRTHHLSELLTEGCGPQCGTAAGSGCGSSCAGCAGCGE